MTRRRIVFTDKNTDKQYITAEFNGDKKEFESNFTNDTCNMFWHDILKTYFSNITTLDEFKIANDKAQKEYISSITGTSTILPIEEMINEDMYNCDIFYYL